MRLLWLLRNICSFFSTVTVWWWFCFWLVSPTAALYLQLANSKWSEPALNVSLKPANGHSLFHSLQEILFQRQQIIDDNIYWIRSASIGWLERSKIKYIVCKTPVPCKWMCQPDERQVVANTDLPCRNSMIFQRIGRLITLFGFGCICGCHISLVQRLYPIDIFLILWIRFSERREWLFHCRHFDTPE